MTDEEIENDKKRQGKIEALGIIFLRFTNGKIYNGLDLVMEKIEIMVKELMNSPFHKVGI